MNLFRLAIAATVLALAAPQFSSAQDQPAAPKVITIATVNLGKAFDNYYKKKQFDAELLAERNKRLEIIRERRKEIAKLKEEMALFDLGTQARKRTEATLFRKRLEFETYQRLAQEDWLRRQKDYTVKLFDEIRTQVAAYAKANHIDLVLKADEPETSAKTLDMIQLEIKLHTVLYHNPAIDITDKVLALLNADQPAPSKQQ